MQANPDLSRASYIKSYSVDLQRSVASPARSIADLPLYESNLATADASQHRQQASDPAPSLSSLAFLRHVVENMSVPAHLSPSQRSGEFGAHSSLGSSFRSHQDIVAKYLRTTLAVEQDTRPPMSLSSPPNEYVSSQTALDHTTSSTADLVYRERYDALLQDYDTLEADYRELRSANNLCMDLVDQAKASILRYRRRCLLFKDASFLTALERTTDLHLQAIINVYLSASRVELPFETLAASLQQRARSILLAAPHQLDQVPIATVSYCAVPQLQDHATNEQHLSAILSENERLSSEREGSILAIIELRQKVSYLLNENRTLHEKAERLKTECNERHRLSHEQRSIAGSLRRELQDERASTTMPDSSDLHPQDYKDLSVRYTDLVARYALSQKRWEEGRSLIQDAYQTLDETWDTIANLRNTAEDSSIFGVFDRFSDRVMKLRSRTEVYMLSEDRESDGLDISSPQDPAESKLTFAWGTERANLERAIATLEDSLKAEKQMHEETKKQYSDLAAIHTQLATKKEQAAESARWLREETAALSDQLQSSKNVIAQLQKDVSSSVATEKSLRGDCARLQAKIADMTTFIEELTTKADTNRGVIQDLRAELAALAHVRQDLIAEKTVRERAEIDFTLYREINEAKIDDLFKQNSTLVSTHRENLAALQSRLDDTEKKLSAANNPTLIVQKKEPLVTPAQKAAFDIGVQVDTERQGSLATTQFAGILNISASWSTVETACQTDETYDTAAEVVSELRSLASEAASIRLHLRETRQRVEAEVMRINTCEFDPESALSHLSGILSVFSETYRQHNSTCTQMQELSSDVLALQANIAKLKAENSSKSDYISTLESRVPCELQATQTDVVVVVYAPVQTDVVLSRDGWMETDATIDVIAGTQTGPDQCISCYAQTAIVTYSERGTETQAEAITSSSASNLQNVVSNQQANGGTKATAKGITKDGELNLTDLRVDRAGRPQLTQQQDLSIPVISTATPSDLTVSVIQQIISLGNRGSLEDLVHRLMDDVSYWKGKFNEAASSTRSLNCSLDQTLTNARVMLTSSSLAMSRIRDLKE